MYRVCLYIDFVSIDNFFAVSPHFSFVPCSGCVSSNVLVPTSQPTGTVIARTPPTADIYNALRDDHGTLADSDLRITVTATQASAAFDAISQVKAELVQPQDRQAKLLLATTSTPIDMTNLFVNLNIVIQQKTRSTSCSSPPCTMFTWILCLVTYNPPEITMPSGPVIYSFQATHASDFQTKQLTIAVGHSQLTLRLKNGSASVSGRVTTPISKVDIVPLSGAPAFLDLTSPIPSGSTASTTAVLSLKKNFGSIPASAGDQSYKFALQVHHSVLLDGKRRDSWQTANNWTTELVTFNVKGENTRRAEKNLFTCNL